MKLYFLTDESEKSLAPFYSKPVLDTVLASTVIVAAFLLVFWLRRPLAEFIATGSQPKIFFLTFAATLIVNSYVNLCCGCGGLVRKGYHIISYQTDKATYEMEIDFYRYGMIEFCCIHYYCCCHFCPCCAWRLSAQRFLWPHLRPLYS